MRSATSGESLAKRAAWSARLAWRAPLEARFPFRSPEAIERAQRRRLRATVAHAYEHVPYYRETMRTLGLTPADITRAEDIARLPLIERDQLQRDPEYFVSQAWPSEAYLRLRSGGSSGQPITVFRHPVALFEGAAYRERIRSTIAALTGKRLRFREALIALPDHAGARHEFGRRTLLPSSVRLTRRRFSLLTPPAEMVDELNRFRPDVIATYGSYLEALFQYVLESGAPFTVPKVVVYSSDALSEQARTLITMEFGVEVLSAYRAIEAPYVGFECDRHTGHHLNVDLSPVRIVTSQGEDVPPGETGEVVVSNLYGRGTILLNYRLGDLAALIPAGCSCGRSLPLLSMVHGRLDEWLVRADGEPVHGQIVRDVMRLREDVLRYQVVQEEPTRFTIAAIVAPHSDRESLSGWLEDRIRERFGDEAEVLVAFPADLPRTPGGKTKPVTSLVGTAAAPASTERR
jgi:phenylacetate-CoA ligase